MTNKIGQFTLVPLLERNKEQAEAIRQAVEEIKALNLPKRPASTIQCASTQATLNRDPSFDEAHRNRPLPESVVLASKIQKAAYESGDLVELERLLGTRKLSLEEISYVESVRRRSKNTQAQSSKSSVSDAAIEKAVDAFIYSPPVELTEQEIVRIKNLKRYSELPAVQEVVEVKQKKFSYIRWPHDLIEFAVIVCSIWFFSWGFYFVLKHL